MDDKKKEKKDKEKSKVFPIILIILCALSIIFFLFAYLLNGCSSSEEPGSTTIELRFDQDNYIASKEYLTGSYNISEEDNYELKLSSIGESVTLVFPNSADCCEISIYISTFKIDVDSNLYTPSSEIIFTGNLVPLSLVANNENGHIYKAEISGANLTNISIALNNFIAYQNEYSYAYISKIILLLN